MWDIHKSCQLKKVELATWVPDLAPGQIRRPPPPCPVSHSHSQVLRYPHANFQHPTMSLGWIFIFGFWPAPWLFSQNAPAGRHTHALRYPHANFQPPSMSLGWIFILGVLAPWSAPLAFFAKRTHNLSFPYPPLPTCKISAS